VSDLGTYGSVGDAVRAHVDRILCLTCPQGYESRYPSLRAEFDRYGLCDILIPCINVYSLFEHEALNGREFANAGAKATNVKNCALGHYHMAKFALDAGYASVMLVEDDCRFGDADTVVRYLEDLPCGSNAVMSYYGLRGPGSWRVFPRRGWARWGVLPPGSMFDFTTCYALNTDGLSALVRHYETAGLPGSSVKFDAADRMLPRLSGDVKLYISRVSLFSQSGSPSVIHGRTV